MANKQNEKSPNSVACLEQSIQLHLGSGLNFDEEWTNMDGSLGVLVAKIPGLHKLLSMFLGQQPFLNSKWDSRIIFHDFRKPLPYRNGSVSVIYSAHMLEHLYKSEQESLISECYRVLIPNGLIRIVVPDLQYIVQQYLNFKTTKFNSRDEKSAADQFNRMMCSHPPSPYSGNLFYRFMKRFNSFQEHRWMHDAESLSLLLNLRGFQNTRICKPFDSGIRNLAKVELNCGIDSVCVEAEHP